MGYCLYDFYSPFLFASTGKILVKGKGDFLQLAYFEVTVLPFRLLKSRIAPWSSSLASGVSAKIMVGKFPTTVLFQQSVQIVYIVVPRNFFVSMRPLLIPRLTRDSLLGVVQFASIITTSTRLILDALS